MQISYDYEELMQELKDDFEDMEEIIQILRDEESLPGVKYYPIIDWYYNTSEMDNLIPHMNSEAREQYELDYPHLKEITVKAALEEMEKANVVL